MQLKTVDKVQKLTTAITSKVAKTFIFLIVRHHVMVIIITNLDYKICNT